MPSSSPHYFEAPHRYRPEPGSQAVFLAGGITNCPRWHTRAAEAIRLKAPDAVILNPNRARFPIDDPSAGWEQVSWEQLHMHLPGVLTLFWFPACDPRKTVQPIAMFELGQALGERRELVVGADPGYPREQDVRMLTRINAPNRPVRSSLDEVVADALDWLDSHRGPAGRR